MARIGASWFFPIVLLTAVSAVSCSDVGDNTPMNPGSQNGGRDASVEDGSTAPGAADSSVDGTTRHTDGSAEAAAADATTDRAADDVGSSSSGSSSSGSSSSGSASSGTPPATGSGVSSSGNPVTGMPDTGTTNAPDATTTGMADSSTTSPPDTGTKGADAGGHDATAQDATTGGTPDSGAGNPPDTGTSGTPEAGGAEAASSSDTGTPDSGASEAGLEPDGGAPETGTPDAGSHPDTGAPDARAPDGGPSPCAIFNNPPGVTTLGCTPTEQKFVDKSVECYTCLVTGSCLNDQTFGDVNKECEDLPGTATGGARAGTSSSTLCLDTIDCILSTKCASADVSSCYCGSLLGSACATATVPATGLCAQAEADGSNHLITEPASVVSPSLGDVTLPAGRANGIFSCAALNLCATLCAN